MGVRRTNIYTLVEMAKLNQLEPCTYLKKVLEALPNIDVHDEEKLMALLPMKKSD